MPKLLCCADPACGRVPMQVKTRRHPRTC